MRWLMRCTGAGLPPPPEMSGIIPVPYSPLNASTPRGSAWACGGIVAALWRGRFLAIGQR
jgi:hypothetical protein